MKARWVVGVLLVNVLLTLVTGGILGPAESKLSEAFGLHGFTARLPFFLVPLYLAPAVLFVRSRAPWVTEGVLLGLMVAAPLALWAFATRCTVPVVVGYLVSGLVQGVLLRWMVRVGRGGVGE